MHVATNPAPSGPQSAGRKNVNNRPQTITPIHIHSEMVAMIFADRGASGDAPGAVARR
jgi:hypothetical protein